jgi:hypothetical protein
VVDEENFHNIYTHLFPWGEEVSKTRLDFSKSLLSLSFREMS